MCFCDVYDVNLWEKKLGDIFVEFHHLTEATAGGVLQKEMVLKILQYSQENTCAGVFLQTFRSAILLKKRTPTLILFCEFCQTLKNIYFEEHSRTSASYFMKKNRQSWRLNNSGEKFLNQWKSTGKDTLRKFLFRAFHEIQFQGQFMKHEILS